MLFTKQGDDGTTTLANGTRVNKDHVTIEFYGTLDELSSHIGWLAANITAELAIPFQHELQLMEQAQRLLFNLAVDRTSIVSHEFPIPQKTDVEALETQITTINTEVDGLFKGFVLPGGHRLAAHAHVVRTLCRRTERQWVAMQHNQNAETLPINQAETLPYINRLSDFFYALAKKINYLTEYNEKKAH